jgi:DNA-nicking Smr family endonuclease
VTKKKKVSQEDIDTWQNYIRNPKDVTDKDESKLNNKFSNYRFKFDLHGFTLEEANKKVKDIILYCIKKKNKEILLITGKGIHSSTDNDIYVSKNLGKLKYSVPEYIKSNSEISQYVLSISNAEKKDGGEGAIVIRLKNL